MPAPSTYHSRIGKAGDVTPGHVAPTGPRCELFQALAKGRGSLGVRYARQLTPDEMRRLVVRGGPARSCVSSQVRCAQAELCDDEWICREYGVMIPPLKRTGRPQRCYECKDGKL